MSQKHRVTVYGRRHIHDHVRTLADWQGKRNPDHTISQEYDLLLLAGIKARYGQDVPLNKPPTSTTAPPAPAIAAQPEGQK